MRTNHFTKYSGDRILNPGTRPERYIKTVALFCLVLLLCWFTNVNAQRVSSVESDSQSLEIMLNRFAYSILPSGSIDADSIHEIAARYEGTLKPNGHWSDLDYSDQSNAWAGGKHLTRVLFMAKSVRLNRDAGKQDSELMSKTLTALNAWIDPDPQNRNWWWNRIGIPQLVGEIAALIKPDLPSEVMGKAIVILKRSDMKGETGANLSWCAINQIVLGCLEKSPEIARTAFDRLWEEVRFADSASHYEGIQPDYSFHQHGPQLYSGGYGLAYAIDVGRFIYVSWGTHFQIPTAKWNLYNHFMLDGIRWITWADIVDYSTIGREITRPGIVAAPPGWSSEQYSLGRIARLLSTLPVPRRQKYADWAACLNRRQRAKELTGNKQFWCSDYMVHRRSKFMTSVKMFSTRIRNAELVNGEGRMSYHLSDGANFLYLTGHEYQDIFPCWDWQKIPGTTAEQVLDMHTIEPHPIGTFGKTDFVGGVSDGTYGLCAMHLLRGALEARKSWFFFDNAYVCLGAGITISNEDSVVTTVIQVRLQGPVLDAESDLPLSKGTHTLQDVHWVHHDHVAYVFAKGQKVILSNQNHAGRWSDIGSGSDKLETQPIFSLWIDHGSGCKNADYDYTVLPAATVAETRQWAKNPGTEVLKNTAEVQAVYCRSKKLLEVAFWSAGEIKTPLGPVSVNQPCLLLVMPAPDGRLQVTVSNPRNLPLVVNLHVGKKVAVVDLPEGAAAGSSVSQMLNE